MLGKRAQFTLEFIVLIAFMFTVFLVAMGVITSKILDAREAERQQVAESIATLARSEIELAASVSDGYRREFRLPKLIDGNTYDIEVLGNREIVVNYIDKEYVAFLKVNVYGPIGPGLNVISKIGGVIYLDYLQPAVECEDSMDNDGDGYCDFSASSCTDGSVPGDAGCTSELDPDESDCGDNVCEGSESWPACIDCPADDLLLMKQISDAIKFDEEGAVFLKGTLTENTESFTTTLDDEFVFNDAQGSSVAIINLVSGNMLIKGSLFENQAALNPPAGNNFVVKNYRGEVVSYIDESGNFYMKKALTENGIP